MQTKTYAKCTCWWKKILVFIGRKKGLSLFPSSGRCAKGQVPNPRNFVRIWRKTGLSEVAFGVEIDDFLRNIEDPQHISSWKFTQIRLFSYNFSHNLGCKSYPCVERVPIGQRATTEELQFQHTKTTTFLRKSRQKTHKSTSAKSHKTGQNFGDLAPIPFRPSLLKMRKKVGRTECRFHQRRWVWTGRWSPCPARHLHKILWKLWNFMKLFWPFWRFIKFHKVS